MAWTTCRVGARARKTPVEIPLEFPRDSFSGPYIVMGIDPSLSRTGIAFITVQDGTAKFTSVGSIAPGPTSLPIWARSKAIGLTIKEQLLAQIEAVKVHPSSVRLIMVMEAPIPGYDYLSSLQDLIKLTLFEGSDLYTKLNKIQMLMVNAATLRSLMGLTQKGSKNKLENVARAYDFLDKKEFPTLDTDACDAVLLALMGRQALYILTEQEHLVPVAVKVALCSAEEITKGIGARARTFKKGVLHRPEYWYALTPNVVTIAHKDARSEKNRSARSTITI